MNPSNPLITVVITTYNYAAFLEDSLLSVFHQDYPQSCVEVIVVDDGSTDETAEILKKFENRIIAIRQANAGQATALNRGIAAAKGKIVALLDPDDEWYPDKLTCVVREFEDSDVGMVQHALDVKSSVSRTRRFPKQLSQGWVREEALTCRFSRMPTSALVFRKAVLDKLTPVPALFRTGGADWYLSIQAALVAKIAAIQKPLGVYSIHDRNAFSNNFSTRGLQEQIQCVEEVFRQAKSKALSLGMEIPGDFEANLFADYPMECKIHLAWSQRKLLEIPLLYRDYIRKYALREFGYTLRFMTRASRMAACSILPPSVYLRLFYSNV